MESILIVNGLAVLGLMLGSFAGATVWRLRARQLVEDKKAGEKIEKKEYDTLLPLTRKSFTSDRSVCLHCGHRLAWYDLIPLVSWLSTKGRCRYCKKKIGWFEPVIELSLACFFIASYAFWPLLLSSPLDIIHFALWLVAGVMLTILVAYDWKWFLLPDVLIFPLIALSFVVALLQISGVEGWLSLAGAVIVLSGLYFALWLASKGEWVGFGDVKLGLALAFLLADWQLAVIAFLAANVIGCLIVVPGMFLGKLTRKTRVPFGPLLVFGMIIAFFFGRQIIDWYIGFTFL